MGKKRIVAGIVVLAVIAGGGIIGYRAYRAQAANEASCASITAQIDERGATIVVPGAEPVTTIIGDSYTSGDGLENYRDSWAFQYAAITGSETHIAGVGRTGYINGGFCGGQTYTERLPKEIGSTLIVQGGLNDAGEPGDDILKAASKLLASVERVETVVVVGPVDVPGRDGEAKIDAALAEAADAAGRRYVSALGWKIQLQADGTHPSEKGAKEFAALLAREIVVS